MIEAGVSIQRSADSNAGELAERLYREAIGAAGLSRPDGAWLALTGEAAALAPELLSRLRERLGPGCALVGAGADGLLARGEEVSGEPAAMLLGWRGAQSEALLVEDLAGREDRAGAELAAHLEGESRPGDLLLLWMDPDALLPGPLLEGLRDPALEAALVAGVAAAPHRGRSLVWAQDRAAPHSLAALRIRPPSPPRLERVPGCRAVTPPLEVTRARGTWILGLAGRPALDVYRSAALGPLASDLRRAARFLKLGVLRGDDAEESGASPPAIRNVIGFDERKGAFSVAEPLRSGDRVALVLGDAAAAREDLKEALQRAADPQPALGFYLGCRGGGESSFGAAGVEAGYLAGELGGAPVAGVHGAFQLAPGPSGPELHTYSAILALLDKGPGFS